MLKQFLINLGVKNMLAFYKLLNGYLKNEGWNLSVKQALPLDKEGLPLPWYTYSSIHFLNTRIHKELTVFEYGSGNSTFWFSDRVKKVVSVEHDNYWYSLLKNNLQNRSNVEYLSRSLGSGNYQNEILNYSSYFDIIVIDGRQRVECSLNSLSALNKGGVIIWDNADRERYSEGYNFLLSKGFKRLDFWGIGPINSYSWCTSVFYKQNNCLNI